MLRPGDLAPDFELVGVDAGATGRFRLGDETGDGRAVVVFFSPIDGRADRLERRLRRASWFWRDAPVAPCVVDTAGQDAGRLATSAGDAPCPVLLDPYGVVAEWFGVAGRRERALFVVGSDGRVAYAWYESASNAWKNPVRGVVDAILRSAPAAWPEPA